MERLSRRNILGAASVIAGGAFLPADPGATTLLADPVATLGEVRRAAYMRAEALAAALDNRSNDGTPEYRAASKAVGDAWDAVQEVEDRMAAMVATTPAGIAAQAETLRDFLAVSDGETMLDRIIAGLAALGQGGGA